MLMVVRDGVQMIERFSFSLVSSVGARHDGVQLIERFF
jgi:hypothetical protein